MSLSAVLLAVLLILWGITQLGVTIPLVVLAILAIVVGVVMFVERVHPIRTI